MINTKNYENNISKIIGEKYQNEINKDYKKIHDSERIFIEKIRKIKQQG